MVFLFFENAFHFSENLFYGESIKDALNFE